VVIFDHTDSLNLSACSVAKAKSLGIFLKVICAAKVVKYKGIREISPQIQKDDDFSISQLENTCQQSISRYNPSVLTTL